MLYTQDEGITHIRSNGQLDVTKATHAECEALLRLFTREIGGDSSHDASVKGISVKAGEGDKVVIEFSSLNCERANFLKKELSARGGYNNIVHKGKSEIIFKDLQSLATTLNSTTENYHLGTAASIVTARVRNAASAQVG